LFIYWYFYATIPSKENLIVVLPYLIFSWVFLFWLSKIFFLWALKYISLPRLSSSLALYPIFTIIYSIILFSKYPTLTQSIWLLPMIIWVLIFFRRIDIEKLFRNKTTQWNT
jgi:drug/metabolite transporter (DMT)-like permease